MAVAIVVVVVRLLMLAGNSAVGVSVCYLPDWSVSCPNCYGHAAVVVVVVVAVDDGGDGMSHDDQEHAWRWRSSCLQDGHQKGASWVWVIKQKFTAGQKITTSHLPHKISNPIPVTLATR